MSRYTDEDGIDGPFDRAMKRAMKDDAKRFSKSTSTARRGDMTRDRKNHTTAYAAASGDEHPEAVVRRGPLIESPNKLPDADGAVQAPPAAQPGALSGQGADYEAIGREGVGSPGGGPGAVDVDAEGQEQGE